MYGSKRTQHARHVVIGSDPRNSLLACKLPLACELPLTYAYFLWLLYTMESPLMMLVHALLIAVILYLVMFYGLRQADAVAQARSMLIGAVVLIYMLLFGHGLPTSMRHSML